MRLGYVRFYTCVCTGLLDLLCHQLVGAELLRNFNLTIVTYGSPNRTLLSALPYTAPGYQVAVEEMRKYGYNIKHVLVQNEKMATCKDLEAEFYLVAKFYYDVTAWDRRSLFVLTTPGCDELVTLADLSREWDVLILASGNAFPGTGHDINRFPTAISFSAVNLAVWTKTFAAIFNANRWTSVSLIYALETDTSDSNSFFTNLANSLLDQIIILPNMARRVNFYKYKIDTRPDIVQAQRRDTLTRAKALSRVFILALRANETRQFMIAAARLNMTTSDYVYFTAEPFRSEAFFGNLKAEIGDENDQVAKEAFPALLQLTSCSTKSPSEGLRKTLDRIKERSRLYDVDYKPGEDPNYIVLASYISVTALGMSIRDALESNFNVSNAAAFAKSYFVNHTWKFLEQDMNIWVDEFGDLNKDTCVRSYDNASDSFESVVMYYDPTLRTLSLLSPINWRTEDGKPPPNEPKCDYLNNNPICKGQNNFQLTTGVAVAIVVVSLATVVALAWRLRHEYVLKDEWWRIEKSNLVVPDQAPGWSRISAFSLSTMGNDPKHIRRYKGNNVWVKKVPIIGTHPVGLQRSKRLLLRELKVIVHDNLALLIGVCIETGFLHFVFEFCGKGSLFHLLQKMNLDWEFRAALFNDLIEGIIVIHASVFKRHGYLNPYICLIDKRFTLKISEFGLYDITKNLAVPKQKISSHATLSFVNVERWIPPELLKAQQSLPVFDLRMLAASAGPEADIYALGGIIDAVLDDSPARDIGSGVSVFGPREMAKLISACQIKLPASRPTIQEVKHTFHQKVGVKTGGFLDSLIRRMQKYARKLEFAVRDRTDALNAERKLCEKLLVEMLPRIIVEKLRAGCTIEPEHFPGVTIYFSVIVGFVEFVATKSPLDVIEFLNHVFSSYDDALSMYSVYKVETISDCYMVVSGLPVPNDHFDMQSKIGIHSGSCAAGVIGSKRPRYCLFGDTVNTASRLATHGKPSKIHLSTATSSLIIYNPDFKVVERGIVDLKGKGKERTFWLESK